MDQHASVSSGILPALLQFQDDILDRQQNEIGADAHTGITFAYKSLPEPPVSPVAQLFSPKAELPPADGVDRISILPDQILRGIVSRLPARDAARTAALASRWRGVWHSVPLTLVDAHLAAATQRVMVVDGNDDVSRAVVAAVSRALEAHPGPFRFVRLIWNHMASHRERITVWIQLLADKGVQELDFINRPWPPLDLPLPATLFSCTSLTRLHIGAWKFPDTAALPDGAGFPHLKELFITFIVMKDEDLAFLLKCCPVLEILTIIGSGAGLRLSLVSHSLRSLQLIMCSLADLAVEDAPCLERLILLGTHGLRIGGKICVNTRITIGNNAPSLCVLGQWQPGEHQLKMGKTVIEVGTKVSSSTTAPSVRILSLEVQFGIPNEVRTLPSFLKCFPNVEALHIFSRKVSEPTGKVNLQFFLDAGTVECVQLHVKKLVFHDFRGNKSELAFLKFIALKARMLESMVILLCPGSFAQDNDSNAKLMTPLTTVKWASEDSELMVLKSPFREGSRPWSFRMASGFSCSDDPFDLVTAEHRSGASVFPHP